LSDLLEHQPLGTYARITESDSPDAGAPARMLPRRFFTGAFHAQ
jgi:hypothetical protein